MFFPEGTTLGKFTTLDGVQSPKDGNPVFVDPGSIRILQDGRTASAAEYLIATLKEGLPGKVTTFGSRTYGKSHTVRQIPLQGGGDLTVTESLMSTPQGRSWDKTGLDPDQSGKSAVSESMRQHGCPENLSFIWKQSVEASGVRKFAGNFRVPHEFDSLCLIRPGVFS